MGTIVTLSIICGLLLCIVFLLGYACIILSKKVETYEEWIKKTDDLINSLQSDIDVVYTELKSVDDRNLFEKDDDVGFVFSEIVRIIKTFNDKIKNLS
jgi:hypothetical protein